MTHLLHAILIAAVIGTLIPTYIQLAITDRRDQ